MESERHAKVSELFAKACDLPADEREAFFEEACAGDPDRRAQLASLLAAVNKADPFFDSLADAVLSLPHWPDDSDPDAALEPDLFIGRTVHQYRIEEMLGRGGMGVVYRAHDTTLDRSFALKFLPRHVTGDEDAAERFLVEARAAAALDHPNVCNVYEIGEDEGGRRFIAMAYYEGETLKQRLEHGPLPIEEAIDYARQIAAGLGAAHTHDIVHRDIKPGNVIVTPEGVAKVLDFGLAKLTDVSLTGTGTTLGTVAYMSPEQAQGEPADHRTDLWSLGVVLYEMLTGERPFKGESTAVLLHRIQTENPEPPSTLRRDVPLELEAVVGQLLAKEREQRPASVEAVGLDTGEATLARGVFAKRRGPWAPLRSRRAVYAGTVILALATVAVISSRWSLGGSDLPEDVVVVIPFSNETGDAAYDVAGRMASQLTTDLLSRSGRVRVVPWTAVMLSWESALERRAREPAHDPRAAVATELGAGTVVGGSIFLQSDSLILQAEVSGGGGARLDQSIDPVTVHSDSIMKGIGALSERVIAGLAFHQDPAWTESAPFIAPMPSRAVYEDYTRAYEVGLRGDREESRRLLERALRQDSAYLGAKVSLAVVLHNLGDFHEADSLLRETEGANDRLGPLHRSQWDWLRATLDGDREAAYRVARNSFERFPSPLGQYTVGFEAAYLNHPGEALRVLDALDPDTPMMEMVANYWAHLTQALHRLGDHDRELIEARRGRDRHPDNPVELVAEILAHAALGNVQEVADLVEEAILKDALPLPVSRIAARELRAHGYYDASRAIGERALAYLRSHPAQGALTRADRYNQLRILYVLERWDDATVLAEDLAREWPSDVDYLGSLGSLAARRGERDEALRISQELASLDRPYLRGLNTFHRALISAVLGEQEQAVSLLRQAHQEGIGFSIQHHRLMNLEPLRGYPPFDELMRPKG